MTKQVQTGILGLLVVAGLSVGAVVQGVPNRAGSQLVAVGNRGNVPTYTITASFETDQINNRMLVSHSWSGPRWLDQPQRSPMAPDSQSTTRLVSDIHRLFRPNPHPEAVLHGNSASVPMGWAYIELRNATGQPQHLVLSMPQYRCNRATLWMGMVGEGREGPRMADRFTRLGTLQNTTPLGDRFYPFFNYAFPLAIPPQATVFLLLRTQSRASFHEVDVQLSRQRAYAQATFMGSIRDGANVVVFFILAVVALLIGWLSASRLLRWYGIYLLSLSSMCASHAGYLSGLPYPDWLSINADTVGTLGRLGINILIHPFFYVLIRPAIHWPRRYKWGMGTICAANALFMGLHLLPVRLYDPFIYWINIAMVSLSLVNMGWLLLFSVVAYWRARIWSPLALCLVTFIPLVLNQLLSVLRGAGEQDTYRQPALNPLLIILALSYLTFEQFRKELVTRQRAQTEVREAQERNNALRREEIEGIGRNLHDQVGNTLATALGYVGRLPADADKLRVILADAIQELRFLSHNLVKDDDRPLTSKVDTLVSRFNDFAAIELSFADYTDRRIDQLPALKQQNLYSIIQELLTNIIRHAKATQASVQFFYDGTTIDVSVEDDGIGIDLLAASGGIGIENMYKRAALSNIDVRFDGAPTGTTVLLRTPLYDPFPNHPH